MIQPVFTYCGLLQLKLNESQKSMLQSIDRRAKDIVCLQHDSDYNVVPIQKLNRRRACLFVSNVVKGEVCENFNNYFHVRKCNTRNNGCLVTLPRIRTEYARKSVSFMAAYVFNELPITIRKEVLSKNFPKILSDHFV